jgi:hypothetical protein
MTIWLCFIAKYTLAILMTSYCLNINDIELVAFLDARELTMFSHMFLLF